MNIEKYSESQLHNCAAQEVMHKRNAYRTANKVTRLPNMKANIESEDFTLTAFIYLIKDLIL